MTEMNLTREESSRFPCKPVARADARRYLLYHFPVDSKKKKKTNKSLSIARMNAGLRGVLYDPDV